MTEAIRSPQLLEPQSEYTQQDLPRGIEGVRDAELKKCATTSVVDTLVAVVCPCVSLAQVASSTGSSYRATLAGFTVLNLLGFASIVLASYFAGEGYMDVRQIAACLLAELIMFFFGPIVSFVLVIAFYVQIRGDGGEEIPYLFLPSIAWDIIFALAAQHVRNKLRRRVGVPRDGVLRVLFSTTCCIWYNIAATTSSAKKFKSVSSCHVGVLDTIPPFEPSDKQIHSAV
ncbi:hypothetical protein Poli38472_009498 [Pythium oligandrum]|uniref:Uncharacterized protein n=1 Tax=Pythium oligandrum TaxID=41045 RepID=A0A8K1CF09_PYTOL|nr:hypothetical protein Poli38472_009498 [Pythium oligandrum]|eukprot:TMW62005.1 hypothetical protein Poli38472_009498 [Pythium oligandrum]